MRKLISVLLCILMLSCVVTAQAAQLNSLVSAYEIVEDSLMLYSTVLPQNGSLTVTVDDQPVEDAQMTTVRKAHLPVTVYCLVDLSTHLSDKQFRQELDALNTISSRMGEQDTMVITTVGKVITEGAVLETYEARRTAIEMLKRDVYTVDMYQAISDAVTSLQMKTNYNANRCLLILSDGDCYKQGQITQQDAANAVNKVDFPIYVLGVTGEQVSELATQKAQNVIKMAELTMGGVGLIPADASITAAQAAEKIWETIQESNVIQINLSAVALADSTATVHAVYEVSNERYESRIPVDLTRTSTEQTVIQENNENGGSVNTNEEDSFEEEDDWLQFVKDNAIVFGAAAVVVLALILIVVIAVRRRKIADVGVVSETINTPTPDVNLDANVIFEEDMAKEQIMTQQASASSAQKMNYPKTTYAADSKGDTVTVQFAVATHKDVKQTFSLTPNAPKVLGRDDRSDVIINNEDNQLSGRHCNVEWDGSYLYIQDAGSTNGTYINSNRLKPNAWSRLENGTVVTMGSFDYVVTIS